MVNEMHVLYLKIWPMPIRALYMCYVLNSNPQDFKIVSVMLTNFLLYIKMLGPYRYNLMIVHTF